MSLDTALFLAINGLSERSASMDWMMLALARPGNLVVPACLVLAYWSWINTREALIGTAVLAAVVAVGDVVGAQVKHLVARVRPCQILETVHELVGCGGTFSFPSNHAVNTAAAAAFGQVLYPRSGWITWPLVGLIGFSRVYVGAHFVTDVIGGWVIGAALGAGAGWLLLRSNVFGIGARREGQVRQ